MLCFTHMVTSPLSMKGYNVTFTTIVGRLPLKSTLPLVSGLNALLSACEANLLTYSTNAIDFVTTKKKINCILNSTFFLQTLVRQRR